MCIRDRLRCYIFANALLVNHILLSVFLNLTLIYKYLNTGRLRPEDGGYTERPRQERSI